MEKIKSKTLIRILEKNRELLNRKFAFAQYQDRSLDAHIFFKLLRRHLEEVIETHKTRPEEPLESLALTLYDQILSLYTRHYLGDRARHPHFEDSFFELCRHFQHTFFQYPEMFTLLAHATMNMSEMPVGKRMEWSNLIQKLPFSSPATFKIHGFIAAWISGRSAYRVKALELIGNIGIREFAVFFDLESEQVNETVKTDLIQKMKANPWFDPIREVNGQAQRTITARVLGGFKGFDQHFVLPPGVSVVDGQLCVSDSKSTFLLYADAFGEQWISVPEVSDGPESESSPFPLEFKDGSVLYRNEELLNLPKLHLAIKSKACVAHTCCVSSHSSYKVFLFGLGNGASDA